MKTTWKVNPLWVGLAVAAAGAAVAIEGALRFSVPIAITGIAMTIAAPAAWVLWSITGISKKLGLHLHPQGRNRQMAGQPEETLSEEEERVNP